MPRPLRFLNGITRHRIACVLCWVSVAMGLSRPIRLAAQVTTATLVGVVQDSSGAVLPGATATVTNSGTGVTRQAVSNDRGEFTVSAIPPGTYDVKIENPNFKAYTAAGLELGAGQTVRQTYPLQIGEVTQNVAVT